MEVIIDGLWITMPTMAGILTLAKMVILGRYTNVKMK